MLLEQTQVYVHIHTQARHSQVGYFIYPTYLCYLVERKYLRLRISSLFCSPVRASLDFRVINGAEREKERERRSFVALYFPNCLFLSKSRTSQRLLVLFFFFCFFF